MNKKLTVIIITILFTGYFLLLLGAYIFGYKDSQDLTFILLAAIPLTGLYYLITTLCNRLKEIEEEDDDVTSKY